MKKPDTIDLYRILHIDNLDFILKSKEISCPSSENRNPNYIGIGDASLIQSRNSHPIPVLPKGAFSDYVAFYFGARPPMLYNIKNGYNNVTKYDSEDIIYLITNFDTVQENKSEFVFTNGHGYHKLSEFFNQESDLKNVDWETVKLDHWDDTDTDPDRKRRKQAEFLIHHDVPISIIRKIVVYNERVKTNILTKLTENNIECDVVVDSDLYY